MDSIDLKISYAPNSDITVMKPSFTWVISLWYISLFGFLTLHVNTLAAGAVVYMENRVMDAWGASDGAGCLCLTYWTLPTFSWRSAHYQAHCWEMEVILLVSKNPSKLPLASLSLIFTCPFSYSFPLHLPPCCHILLQQHELLFSSSIPGSCFPGSSRCFRKREGFFFITI